MTDRPARSSTRASIRDERSAEAVRERGTERRLPRAHEPDECRRRSSVFSACAAMRSARGTRHARRRSRRARRRRTSPRGASELPRDRGLGDDGERFHGLNVTPLDERLARLPAREVDGAEWTHERRQRLHRCTDDHGLAVRDPALHPACAIRRATSVGLDLVVRLGALVRASAKPSPISTPFTAWIPMSAAARRASSRSALSAYEPGPGGTPSAGHLDDATERVTIRACRVGRALPALLGRLAADLEHAACDRDRDLAERAFATAPATT